MWFVEIWANDNTASHGRQNYRAGCAQCCNWPPAMVGAFVLLVLLVLIVDQGDKAPSIV